MDSGSDYAMGAGPLPRASSHGGDSCGENDNHVATPLHNIHGNRGLMITTAGWEHADTLEEKKHCFRVMWKKASLQFDLV